MLTAAASANEFTIENLPDGGEYTVSVAVRDPVSRNVTPPAASKIKKYRAVEAAQPALTFGAVRRVSPGTATVSIHSNCAGEYYCVMAPEGSGAPKLASDRSGFGMSAGVNTISITNLTPGTEYTLRMRSKNSSGDLSQEVAVKVPK